MAGQMIPADVFCMTRRDDSRRSRRASHHHARAQAERGDGELLPRIVSAGKRAGVIWKSWRARARAGANRPKQSPRRDLAGMHSCTQVACARARRHRFFDSTTWMRFVGTYGSRCLPGPGSAIFQRQERHGRRMRRRRGHARQPTAPHRTGSVAGRGKG